MKELKMVIIGFILVLCGVIMAFDFTMKHLEVKEINEKENVVVITILNQDWVYEK